VDKNDENFVEFMVIFSQMFSETESISLEKLIATVMDSASRLPSVGALRTYRLRLTQQCKKVGHTIDNNRAYLARYAQLVGESWVVDCSL